MFPVRQYFVPPTIFSVLENGFSLDFWDPYTDFFLQRLQSSIKV